MVRLWSFLLLLLVGTVVSCSSSLLNEVAQKCLHRLNLNEVKQLKNHIEFWQTWSEMEFLPMVLDSSSINATVKDEARRKPTEWADFDLAQDKIPSHFKDSIYFKDHDYWNPNNNRIIWDDRLWLGCSYMQLYKLSKIEKYLTVAKKLYQLIVTNNADPQADSYQGISWSPKSGYRNSVTNELFMVLAGRLYDVTKEPKYLQTAKRQQWLLFQQAGKYINNNSLDIFPDGVGPNGFYTYNQGLALEGLSYLVKYGDISEFSLKQLSRLINGMINYFHDKSQRKLIMIQPDSANSVVASIFRGVVFRHLIHAKDILSDKEWGRLLESSPKLRPFLLDNMQTMARFEDIPPGYDWYQYNNTNIKYYTIFNQFFVLRSGEKLFNITERVVEGIQLDCSSVWQISATANVTSIRLTNLELNEDTRYKQAKTIRLERGANFINYLIGEDFCNPRNNRNMHGLEWEYSNGVKQKFTLVHMMGNNFKVGLIPDSDVETIANSHFVRIKSSCKESTKTYVSDRNSGEVTLSSPSNCGKNGRNSPEYLTLTIK